MHTSEKFTHRHTHTHTHKNDSAKHSHSAITFRSMGKTNQ
uniref:Uncharacterized protein n=1 Tax=Anguilla anguilla TaxID=7936 RepID=A0A0E9T3X2_ANGAN